MISLETKTQPEYSDELVRRVRAIRRSQHVSQELLAQKSGVSLGSVKRFERTGEISLTSFIKIVMALDRAADLDELLNRKEYASIEEVIADAKRAR